MGFSEKHFKKSTQSHYLNESYEVSIGYKIFCNISPADKHDNETWSLTINCKQFKNWCLLSECMYAHFRKKNMVALQV